MRIGIDAAPLLGPPTGVGHYTSCLLDELLAMDGLEVSLYALVWKTDTSRLPGGSVRFKQWRIPARMAVTGWEALSFLKGGALVGDVDLVHGTNFWVPPLRDKKSVVTIHDLTFWFYPEYCTPQIRRYRSIVPKMLKRCDLVITPCDTIADEVAAELGFPRERVVATPEGVRGAFLAARPRRDLATRLGVSGDYLLFAGTQEPRKNLTRLIEAFAAMDSSESTLVVAGPPGWGNLDLPGLAARLGVRGRVVFPGYLGDGDLAALVAGAAAFVYPSLYEGFGLPALEAMAAGIPVVAGRAGALPEVLGEAPIWCDPKDTGSITAALQAVMNDTSERMRAVQAGKARAALYNWGETARKTVEAYRKV